MSVCKVKEVIGKFKTPYIHFLLTHTWLINFYNSYPKHHSAQTYGGMEV
jgi:hypothetical protein